MSGDAVLGGPDVRGTIGEVNGEAVGWSVMHDGQARRKRPGGNCPRTWRVGDGLTI